MNPVKRFLVGRGLRSHIIWTTALVSGLAMGAMIGTVVLSLNGATRSNVDATLSDRFQSTRSAVGSEQNSPTQALASSVDSIEDSTWLYDGNGEPHRGPQGRAARAGRGRQARHGVEEDHHHPARAGLSSQGRSRSAVGRAPDPASWWSPRAWNPTSRTARRS